VRKFVGIAKKSFYQVQYLFFTINRTWYKGLANGQAQKITKDS
jgi:hypothetical protein